MRKLVTIDLFAGVGGISLGLMSTGLYKVVALVDWDKVAKENFEHNFPPRRRGSPKYICKDIKYLRPKELKDAAGGREIDVIAGGLPCQGFAQPVAGRRVYEDERNHLFKHYFRIVKALKPKALIIENVPEFLILFEGKIFGAVLKKLDKLGYRFAVDILNAARYGVPQSRQRVIIVAIRKDLEVQPHLPDPTHGGSLVRVFNYTTRNHVVSRRELLRNPAIYDPIYGDDIMGSTSVISSWRSRHLLNPNGYNIEEDTALARYPCQTKRGRPPFLSPLILVEHALSDLPWLKPGWESNKYAKDPVHDYQLDRREKSEELTNHKAWNHTSQMIARLRHVDSGGDISDVPRRMLPNSWYSQAYARLHKRATARTITTFFHNPGSGRFTHYSQVRTITVREAARLQSFDDDFEFIGYPSHHERLIGNAVPPLLVQAIGQQLYADIQQSG